VYDDYSVLMSVYHREKPEYLRQSIESMLAQTVATNDFVIVCDGPLTSELDAVIEEFLAVHPSLFQIARLKENVGIGAAANHGLKRCRNEWVAKMDADDIACSDRCESQLKLIEQNPQLSIVGGYISEFEGTIHNVVSLRKVPITNEDILKYAQRRMPFNNQTVMYRKSDVETVGGYSSLRRCEDYDLYLRMLANGFAAQNIAQVLVQYRLTKDAFKRRGTWNNFEGFFRVRWSAYRIGFSSLWDVCVACSGQFILTLLPASLKKVMYTRLLRK